ncbi:MAG: hypothetical protein H6734_14910 [Alphaproteobacteria bacterium]|nr:hypothetical protein [Alphaproteobacteria bacterium]
MLRHVRPAEQGAAVASLDLPRNAAGGLYTLRARVGDRTSERPIVVAGFEEPRIRKELDLLREAYGPGDEVRAALTLATAGGGPLVDHPVQVLVQVGGRVLPRVESRTDLNGEATLSFRLPDGLTTADVLLTVLVEEAGWQESISRPVPVVLDAVDIQWFPEGGDLVEGLPSRVYLRARNAHGEPADIEGVVVDDLGAEVAAFRTVHDGLGRLPLTPAPGRAYTARLTAPSSLAGKEIPLPAALPEGCVLHTYDDLQGALAALRVGVWCSTEREVEVLGVQADQVLGAAIVEAGPRALRSCTCSRTGPRSAGARGRPGSP